MIELSDGDPMSEREHKPICIGCEYDQSGEIAAWTDRCPIEGQCPECGMGFLWAQMLNPKHARFSWFVEHAQTKRDLIWRTIPTLWYLLIPHRFWTRVNIQTPRSTKRFVLWISSLLLTLHVVGTAMLISALFWSAYTTNAQIRRLIPFSPPPRQAELKSMILDTASLEYWYQLIGSTLLDPMTYRYHWGTSLIGATIGVAIACAGISFLWILMYIVFFESRQRARLRKIHVLRGLIIACAMSLVSIELARILSAGLFLVETVKPGFDIDTVGDPLIYIAIIGSLVWVQWFWISALQIGWKVKANWALVVLLILATYAGGLLVFAFGMPLLRAAKLGLGSFVESIGI